MAAAGSDSRARPPMVFVWIGAAVLLGAGLVFWWQGTRPGAGPPFDLLAQAYTAQRRVAVRFPGARFARVTADRGAAPGSQAERPVTLLEGEARIAYGLRAHPNDPAWLDASGRAELLQGNPEAARELFEKALDFAPNSVALQQDLAMSWFEAAEAARAQGNAALGYGASIELFSGVLRSNAKDAVALFNRALACERLFLFQQAKEDWQRYLLADERGGWAGEARQHLREVESRLRSSLGKDAARMEPGDPAVMKLLAAAFGSQPADGQVRRETRAKLAALAARFEAENSDRWLSALLADAEKPGFGKAVDALRAAFEQNQQVDPPQAVREARVALERFAAVGSEAGGFRAQYELAYGLQLAMQGRQCLRESQRWLRLLGDKPYPWLRAQAHLEISAAWSTLGNLDGWAEEAEQAIGECESHHLLTLRLRGIGFRGAALNEGGRWRSAWNLEYAGLEQFWSGKYAPYRAYQFYDDLSISAEHRSWTELARLLAREAVHTIADTGDPQTEAMERYKLARLSQAAGEMDEARNQFARSRELFLTLPASPAMDLYRSYGLIGLAQAEERRGRARTALDELLPTEAVVERVDNEGLRASFYEVLAETYHRLGDGAASERALNLVLRFGDQALTMLRNEGERLSWAREMDEAYRGMVRLLLEAGQTERAFTMWERYKASDGSDAAAAAEKIRAIGRSLDQTAVVSYMQMEDGIAAWRLDETGLVYRWLPVPRGEMARLARRFTKACSSANSTLEEIHTLGREVYRRLIEAVPAPWFQNRTILLETDGPAALAPFEAIETPDGSWLGDHATFVISPGMLYSLRRSGRAGRAHVLAVGNPRMAVEWSGYAPLPDALAEAKMAAATLPGGVVLNEARASAAGLRQALPSAAIFHFAGHGISTPERSGLLLAESRSGEPNHGFWNAGDLRPGSMRGCALVVLSACSSGELDEPGLIDPDTLVRKFLIAGAGEVVASHWPVDSRATRQLMTLFYGELKCGRSPAAALRAAARRLRSEAGMQNPRYWAAFSVFGPSDKPLTFFNQQAAQAAEK